MANHVSNWWLQNFQAGETTPRDKAKISKAQREIDDWESDSVVLFIQISDSCWYIIEKEYSLETFFPNQSLLLQHLYKHIVQVQ